MSVSVARPADQNVVAGEPVQRVVAVQTQHQVVAGRAVERVVAGCADDEPSVASVNCSRSMLRSVSEPSIGFGPTSVTVSMPSLVEPNA